MATKKERKLNEQIKDLQLAVEERNAAISEYYHLTVAISFLLCVAVFGAIAPLVSSYADPRTLLTFLPLIVVWYALRLRDSILK